MDRTIEGMNESIAMAMSSSITNNAGSVAPETSKSVALRALKAINKSSAAALHLQEIPHEFLFGENVDLHRWTMVLTDGNLEELSGQNDSGKQYFLDASSSNVIGMFHSFYQPLILKEGLLTLNISYAKDITDYGIALIARNNPRLRLLNIAGCSKITDVGIREIGMNCLEIQDLNMSSCPVVDGTGLGAVADMCHHMIKLNVSKCPTIECWAIKKLFYECTLLEEVIVEDMAKVGDEEIRVLAQNCPNLVSLYAADCPYISDASVQIISQMCPDLDLIDLSRSDMMYRISDLSLLALGQKSQSLRTLRLRGCDHLSDVGLTWLSEGCKVLEELDLAGCNKITDAGLRSLGTRCHALRTVNISHAKIVTDIGISSLSKGCPELRHVTVHGVFLLSDPRLAAPKKGAKLEAWQTVIGIAALAENCPWMEKLDLSACFRLNIALHQYVSSFQHLISLNLANCNQTTPEALCAVAKGCKLIEDLILSDCAKAVNNKSIQAFCTNCKGIKTLTLCRCTHITGGGMKAISSLKKLVKLDLSGCRNLNDSMALYLTETDRNPILRTMLLVNIPGLTDSFLAWLSIKSQDILMLALKGTSITKKSMLSVRDRYPNSDLQDNANFYGFWPKTRVDDRMLINHYRKVIDGVVCVQSRVRKVIAQERVAKIHEEWRRIAAQALLQRIVRGFLGRCRTFAMRAYNRKVQLSALILTSIFHVARARKRVKRRKQHLRMRLKNEMASKIQLCWRKHRDRGILAEKRRLYQKYLAARQFGALKMQSIARIYFARNRIRNIKALRRTREIVSHRKATMIQRCWRGMTARVLAAKFRDMHMNLMARRLAAVIRIQRKIRVIRTSRIVHAAIFIRRHRLECIIRVQAVLRGALARLHMAELRTELYEQRRERAVVLLQTRIRMILAYIELQRRKAARKRVDGNRDAAARVINGAVRVKLACVRYKEAKRQHRKKIKEIAKTELNAVCRIQARIRGILGRRYFEEQLRARKGKWKELFDEKVGKRFFYNKLSGEIRWRMPQDLLDLIPHPICDNCTHVNATIECQVCNELFCPTCWTNVHSGGRRRDHNFRALYDYYGKRLDYGDGEFPCKWPSEVMQDEIQGWMLRVAPKRHPLRTYNSGWEEYQEGPEMDPKKKNLVNQSESKLFFFNRNTFEATYEQPDEIVREIRAAEEQALAIQREQEQLANSSYMQNTNDFLQSSGYYDEQGSWIDTTYSNYSYAQQNATVGGDGADTAALSYYGSGTVDSRFSDTTGAAESAGYNYDYGGHNYFAADQTQDQQPQQQQQQQQEYYYDYNQPSHQNYDYDEGDDNYRDQSQKQIGYDPNYANEGENAAQNYNDQNDDQSESSSNPSTIQSEY